MNIDEPSTSNAQWINVGSEAIPETVNNNEIYYPSYDDIVFHNSRMVVQSSLNNEALIYSNFVINLFILS